MSVASAIRNSVKTKAPIYRPVTESVRPSGSVKQLSQSVLLRGIREASTGAADLAVSGEDIGGCGFRATIVTLTPELAKQFIASMPDSQRTPKAAQVSAIASDIKGGRWRLNGEPIIFSKKFKMLNGQHRCLAVIQSGESVRVLVVWGVDDDDFCSIDNVARRSGADVAKSLGFVSCTLSAAAATFVINYSTDPALTKHPRYSNQEIQEFLSANHELIQWSVSKVRAKAPSGMLKESTLAGSHFIFSLIDGAAADDFIDRYCSGVNLTETDPIRLLREKSIRNSVGRIQTKDQFAYIVKAWNAYRAKTPMSLLRWSPENEKFPVVSE